VSTRSLYGKDEEVYIMDAKDEGNLGRYLNHSCEPNVFVQNCFVDTHDLRFPWVAFFSMQYIKVIKRLGLIKLICHISRPATSCAGITATS